MNHDANDMRILSIVPSTRGFGFAVIEDQKILVWGHKTLRGDKNMKSLQNAEALIRQYEPALMVIEDADAKGSQRRARIRKLVPQIAALARSHKLEVRLLSRDYIRWIFLDDECKTKYDIAKLLVDWYPDELADWLPPERKLGDSEDGRMDIFDAVAFGIAFSLNE